MPETRQIEALLFDLGGVVIDIDAERALRCWEPKSNLSLAQMRERLAIDQAFERHERGELDAAQYFSHLRRMFELDASDQEIAHGWNAILVAEITEALDLIRAARGQLPCCAFSNTSPTHHAAWTQAFPNVVAAFDRIFLSFELGHRKPERAAYAAVAREMGVDPASILFFDDTLDNVEGARDAGLQAVHVSSPADIRRGLGAFALL